MSEVNEASISRGQWSGRIGFVLAAAGSAVGLGNIWKFPYVTGENGGGTFVLIYLLCIALVGFPIMIAEIIIGRRTQKSPVGAFTALTSEDSPWRILGWMGLLAGFIILSYYSVVAGWALNYFLMCVTHFFHGKTPEQISSVFGVLLESADIQVFWHFVFMLITVGIVYGGVKKGIEKWSRVLMPLLFLMMLMLVVYAFLLPARYLFSIDSKYRATLDTGKVSQDLHDWFKTAGYELSQELRVQVEVQGSRWIINDDTQKKQYSVRKGKDQEGKDALNVHYTKGFKRAFLFTFSPKPNLKPSSVLEALGQAFFTLSLGMGAILTYGSYLSKKSDIARDSMWICIMDTAIAILACMVLFPIIFAFGHASKAGPGLVFKTMPVLFSQMPGGLLLSTMFFLLLSFAALTSAVSLLEVVTAYFIDEIKWGRKKATLITGGVVFLFGIPSAAGGWIFSNWQGLYGKNFFDTMDYLASNWLLPLGGLLIAIFVGWVMKEDDRKSEFEEGSSTKWLYPLWLWMLRIVVPILVALVLFNKIGILSTEAINNFFGAVPK